ncbi:HugZ family protein [Paenibacillus yanchengensis]|uniref:HugZ family protein n=1 Tax=Paenibacillus yanchengensis TaxID=2035833 RepID=A0ABW4YJ41_9BACL
MKKPVDIEKHRQNYNEFVQSREQVILSMIDEEGKPFTSIAPFVRKDGKFYIYISQIADHYQLMESNEYVDVFLHGDQSETTNKFAVERARWCCTAENIGNDGHEDLFALFSGAFGENIVKLLRGLDFSIFELTPLKGRYVAGFGLAFDLDVEGFHHVVIDKKKDDKGGE